jgi:Ca2+-binding EF-hand superfamily protein
VRRGGSNGMASLGRLLRIMDDDGDKKLSRSELKYVTSHCAQDMFTVWLSALCCNVVMRGPTFCFLTLFTALLCCAGRFGLRDYGIDLNPTELEQVFLYFDSSRDGFIGIDEFLIGEC